MDPIKKLWVRETYYLEDTPECHAMMRLEPSSRIAMVLASDHDAREQAWQAQVDKINEELAAYRTGGVTEEILRRNDGCIKVGQGCVIVREDEWNELNTKQAILPIISDADAFEELKQRTFLAEQENKRLRTDLVSECSNRDEQERLRDKAESALAAMRDSLAWLVNVWNDVGRGGGKPERGELGYAIDKAKDALAAPDPGQRYRDMEKCLKAIIAADERGQGLPFKEAMDWAAKIVSAQ